MAGTPSSTVTPVTTVPQVAIPAVKKKSSSRPIFLILGLMCFCCACTVLIGTIIYILRDSIFPQQACSWDSKSYKNGETFDFGDGCNTCSCTNNDVVCTEMACISSIPTEIEEPTPTIVEITPRKGLLKIYTNETYEYTLKYPSSWKLDTSKASLTEDSGEPIAQLTITYGEYQFVITKSLEGRGVPVCLFTGDGPYEGPEYMEMGAGKLLNTRTGEIWKRNAEWQGQGFVVCEKGEDAFYAAYTQIGVITYITPENPDPGKLAELDAITASIQYLGTR